MSIVSDTTRDAVSSLTGRRRIWFILILGAITSLGPFTMDLYLPAFPRVMADLHTDEGTVQLTLTATAVGMGVGQLVVGPASDALGRRAPLIVATALHVLASIGVAIAPTVAIVGLMRFGQGLGASASAVVSVALVRDMFGGYPLVRLLARVGLINGLAPIAAPVLGSQLLRVVDWRGVFWILTAFGLAVLVAAVIAVPETLPIADRGSHGARSVSQRFQAVVQDRVFVGSSLVGALIFSALVTYLSTSPFILQSVYGLDPQEFGLLFAVIAIGLFASTQSAARLMKRFEPAWLLSFSLSLLLAVGVVLVFLSRTGWGVWGFASTCMVLVAACGFSFPCVQVLALQNQGRQAGTAAATSGFVNSIIGGVVSPLPGLLGGVTATSLGLVVMATMVLSITALWIVVRPRQVNKLDREIPEFETAAKR